MEENSPFKEGLRAIKDIYEKEKTYFVIFRVTLEELREKPDRDIRDMLSPRRNALLSYYEKLLDEEKDIEEKQKIRIEMAKIKEGYEVLTNKDRRETYYQELIQNQYSHESEYNPNLIASYSKNPSIQNKIVVRKQLNNEKEEFFTDREGRCLRVQKKAIIVYLNSAGDKKVLYEKVVKRRINGEERIDTVLTPEDRRADLSYNEKTGRMVNPEYRDYFLNKFLSEEVIQASKYNAGFIGRIYKDEEGNYCNTLERKPLMGEDQEMLAVAMILRQQEISANREENRWRR